MVSGYFYQMLIDNNPLARYDVTESENLPYVLLQFHLSLYGSNYKT